MIIFAIETSCDETATAVVNTATRAILAQNIYCQYTEHAPYGGVIPELASRAHLERLPRLAEDTLHASGLGWEKVDAIAATTGPGLTTALLIGTAFAKTLALALGKPFVPTNHIEGHALTPHLINPDLAFPYLLLLVSGGHCQLVLIKGVGMYEALGTTLDDAVGECFDKVGKLLGLPHPAGPALEKLAKQGHPAAVSLPIPKNDTSLDFSFAGLKTAVRDLLQQASPPPAPADIAASFQQVCAKILAKKAGLAHNHTGVRHLVAAGGVAANATIRAALEEAATAHNATFTAPPLALCTDNAAMIAYAAGLRLAAGLEPAEGADPLATRVRPRWPLSEMSGPNGA